jgi:DNA invertase Pin-like site-specific DNA recombinase
MKLVGYVRISTVSQHDNTSIDEQKARLQAYCSAFGHELVEIYEEMESGKSTSTRPIFQQTLEHLKQDVDGIIATKLDRIARNTRDVLALVEDVLIPNKKALVLLDLNVDTSSPTGIAILTMLAAMAQLERSVIIERTQSGRRRKFEEGGFAYGSPRFSKKSENGILVDNPDEMEIVKIIQNHRRSGKSLGQISKYLNKNGYPSKRGGKWYPQTVKVVLQSTKTDV